MPFSEKRGSCAGVDEDVVVGKRKEEGLPVLSQRGERLPLDREDTGVVHRKAPC